MSNSKGALDSALFLSNSIAYSTQNCVKWTGFLIVSELDNGHEDPPISSLRLNASVCRNTTWHWARFSWFKDRGFPHQKHHLVCDTSCDNEYSRRKIGYFCSWMQGKLGRNYCLLTLDAVILEWNTQITSYGDCDSYARRFWPWSNARVIVDQYRGSDLLNLNQLGTLKPHKYTSSTVSLSGYFHSGTPSIARNAQPRYSAETYPKLGLGKEVYTKRVSAFYCPIDAQNCLQDILITESPSQLSLGL